MRNPITEIIDSWSECYIMPSITIALRAVREFDDKENFILNSVINEYTLILHNFQE